MEVRKAGIDDLDAIMHIVGEARAIMRETGNMTQWSNGYPSREVIAEDIADGQAFLCVENRETVGYFCFVAGQDPEPTYAVIADGKWLNDLPYGVIHRLASGRKAKGIAHSAFEFAFSKTDNVRVDTHADNLPMRNFLLKNVFSHCGTIYVNDGSPRDAFQKAISGSAK